MGEFTIGFTSCGCNYKYTNTYQTKYKVGDKVRIRNVAVGSIAGGLEFYDFMQGAIGLIGTITKALFDETYMIRIDKSERTSTLRYDYSALYWPGEWLKPVTSTKNTKKLVVTSYGTTTVAKLLDGKTTIKTAEAKCSKNDVFCFETGARIAVDRLLGKSEPEKPKFTKADLMTGMFGVTNRNEWFVVIGDRLVFQDGRYYRFDALTDDMTFLISETGEYNYNIKAIISEYTASFADAIREWTRYREGQSIAHTNILWVRGNE